MAQFRANFFLVLVAILLAFDLVTADLLANLRKLWSSITPQFKEEQDGMSGKSFSARSGYYDGGGGGGYPDMISMAAGELGRGWGGGWGWGHEDNQNLDLYSLLGGLSFASLLGATIIYLARRNTSGRRRRSADGLSYLEDDEVDLSQDPQTKGLNILELIDTFLDNRQILFATHDVDLSFGSNRSSSQNTSSSVEEFNETSGSAKGMRAFREKVHLGPGIVPHTLSDPIY